MNRLLIPVLLLAAASDFVVAQVIDPTMHHLRSGEGREWDEFPETAEGPELRLTFNAAPNVTEQTLRIRHRDLKYDWKVVLNGRDLGTLPLEESPMASLFTIPPRALKDGPNDLRVACTNITPDPDDVSIGGVALIDRPRQTLLSEATFDVTVTEADTTKPLPARLTIVDANGDLAPLGLASDRTLAVRTGVVYTADGRAPLRLPAGQYTLCAGRGFEWGVAQAKLDLRPDQNEPVRLAIRREVDTAGYVAADTHVHTFTYSRHGDATLAERVVTLAGEGIELPIATDHNLPVDYDEAAQAAGVREFFTPVVGNEVTTAKLGHFNVFPVDKSARLIDFRAPTWPKLFDDIDAVAPGAVVILNHARDLHGGFRPFDPARHLSITGEDLDGQPPRANAMEVINSGATINDPLLLYRDWMGCLNRGLRLAPIGASDSHNVSRFIVGQGRTYVRCDDRDPGRIDTAAARDAIKADHVLVSFGLLVDLKVNGRFGPGDVAPTPADVDVEIRVKGPAWTRADRVTLYANGLKIREAAIDADHAVLPGVKASVTWKLPKPAHDVYLTAIATGPGVTAQYWPVAKPYQRTSPHWEPYVLGCTGAVYLDADGSNSFQSAYDYAAKMVDAAKDDVPTVVKALADYDASVAAQAASVLRSRHKFNSPDAVAEAASTTPTESVKAGFRAYADAWRESDAARARAAARPAPP
jgi:hypothetical protein